MLPDRGRAQPSREGVRSKLGRLSNPAGLPLVLLGELELRFQRVADGALRDDAAPDVGTRRDLEHRVQQRLLDDRLQRARTGTAEQGELRDCVERTFFKDELD